MGMKPRPIASTHDEYIALAPESQREDLRRLHALVREEAPLLVPTMECKLMGYGPIHYRYASGREGDWVVIGISSLKNRISLHCWASTEDGYVAESYRDRLGKADVGRSCVRFRDLASLDESVLRELIRDVVANAN